ncbi:MAG: DNA alkylation repair protein [Bacteroidota bacterium]
MPHWKAPLKLLTGQFEAAANEQHAKAMQQYMRDQYPFYGIKAPTRQGIQKEFFLTLAGPEKIIEPELARNIWKLPQREWQLMGCDLLFRFAKKAPKQHLAVYEELIQTKSWWDTVDMLASKVVAVHLQRHPELLTKTAQRWIESDNLWLQRSALIFQLKYKDQTDWPLLQELIRRRIDEPDFFIRKAIGWSLRAYARHQPDAVRAFVASHNLSPLSRKEALKHL